MSTIIMTACWPLQGMTPAQKAVLISLADNASDEGVCWPAIGTIARRTCLSERAVQGALKWLEENLAIERQRRSQKSTVYRITPDEYTGGGPVECHYVYRITHVPTGHFYVGLRTTTKRPEDDDYFGSGTACAWLQSRRKECVKEIVATFSEKDEALQFETIEIRSSIAHPLSLNRKISSPGNEGAANAPAPDAPAPDAPAANAPAANAPHGADAAPYNPQITTKRPAANAPGTVKNHQRTVKEPSNTRDPKNIQLPGWMPEETWRDWVEHRRMLKAPLTHRAAELCLKKLDQMRQQGHDPVAVIEQSILSGKWTGLFPVKSAAAPEKATIYQQGMANAARAKALIFGEQHAAV